MGRLAWARRATTGVLLTIGAGAAVASGAAGMSSHRRQGALSAADSFANRVFASGAGISHSTPRGTQKISQPDDITSLAGHIFVGFQNGVGPQGQASTTGNKNSTVVEFDLHGHRVAQWDVAGKCDGLTADPGLGRVIATVNEDANSSVYLIDPAGGAAHYRYNRPLPSHGGTDAIEIDRGMVLISASAPGTTSAAAPRPSYPAVYRVGFDAHTHVATVRPLFFDEAAATVANVGGSTHGQHVKLALTDPDSNEMVPSYARRFAGEFMLTSQGDEEQIFVADAGGPRQSLSVLKLTASVDDSAWPSGPADSLYTTDNGNNTVNRVTGPFRRGSEIVATTPCDETGAPSTCPGPGFPANYLGEVDPNTGVISRLAVTGPTVNPQGMLFLR
jgi:hypothetical protein